MGLTFPGGGPKVFCHAVIEGEERRGGTDLCTHVAHRRHSWGDGSEGERERGREGVSSREGSEGVREGGREGEKEGGRE